jgi:hypothetical protein
MKRLPVILLLFILAGCASLQSGQSYFVDHLAAAWKTDKVLIVLAPLGYQSELVGYIEVPAGFETDLASVPRVPIAYTAWGGRASAEAVIHDYLYRADSVPSVTLEQANDVFFEAMGARGVSPWVRYPMFWGVTLGGKKHFHARQVEDSLNEKDIHDPDSRNVAHRLHPIQTN